jgi:HEAT repeat protein
MEAMGSNDMRVQWAASEKVMREYGKPGLLTALNHVNAGTRARAAHWLGHYRDLDVQNALVVACGDVDEHVRMWAVYSLGEIADAAVLPNVRGLQQDASESVRREARDAIKKLEARIGGAAVLDQPSR